jgi:hypothetical protein
VVGRIFLYLIFCVFGGGEFLRHLINCRRVAVSFPWH